MGATHDPEGHYSELGIPPGSSMDEIKKAYRRRAREVHPDRNPDDPDANEKLRRVNEAYDAVRTVEKRTAYEGKPWLEPAVLDLGRVGHDEVGEPNTLYIRGDAHSLRARAGVLHIGLDPVRGAWWQVTNRRTVADGVTIAELDLIGAWEPGVVPGPKRDPVRVRCNEYTLDLVLQAVLEAPAADSESEASAPGPRRTSRSGSSARSTRPSSGAPTRGGPGRSRTTSGSASSPPRDAPVTRSGPSAPPPPSSSVAGSGTAGMSARGTAPKGSSLSESWPLLATVAGSFVGGISAAGENNDSGSFASAAIILSILIGALSHTVINGGKDSGLRIIGRGVANIFLFWFFVAIPSAVVGMIIAWLLRIDSS